MSHLPILTSLTANWGYQAGQGKSGPHFEEATLLTAFLCSSTVLFAMIYTGKV